MFEKAFTRRPVARHSIAIALATVGMTMSGIAAAGCGGYGPEPATPQRDNAPLAARMMSAVYVPGADAARFIRVGGDEFEGHTAGLVGMWRVTFTSDGTAYPHPGPPAGVDIDSATIQYHSDGTEFQISGSRPPSTGDVCMGVWKQVGEHTYKIKHIALAWQSPDSTPPAPTSFVGPGLFHEEITLNRGRNSFEGKFTIDQFEADETTLIEHISGTMKGTRFTFD
jgi:hypothetical protein